MAAESTEATDLIDTLRPLLDAHRLKDVAAALTDAGDGSIVHTLERLTPQTRAVAYRLLPKARALEVFEALSPALQSDLVRTLQDEEVSAIFAEMEPDARVELLDELPAGLAPRLLHGLSAEQRQLTSVVLGYPRGSVGRRMSPEVISAHADHTVADTLARVRARLDDAETIYTLPVVDAQRRVVGVVSLRDLLRAASDRIIADIAHDPVTATAYEDAETAARTIVALRLPALPIVDNEERLVGILTTDDVFRILESEESEDAARQGGVEPLRRPYLVTPIRSLVRSRIVWLLVLAVGATLTVQVLEVFESTLEQVTILALFIPLLIGIGGNTGNQAATTVTRALALGDVRPGDAWRVLGREVRVGLSLGAMLGLAGGVVTGLFYDTQIGMIIGLTLLSVCTMAATVGGVMPLAARALRVDPAVFSNPFISTFVDATGLVVYFLIARAILQF